MAGTSASSRRLTPGGSEEGFLHMQVEQAQAAMRQTVRRIGTDLLHAIDPRLWTHDHPWAALVALMVVGAAIRHYFIRRHAGETLWWIPVGCACAIAGIAVWLRPPGPAPAQPGVAPVPFAQAQQVVAARCQPCHSLHPTQSGFSSAPANVVLDAPDESPALAAQIKAAAVDSTVMPLGNATKMTQAERDLLGRWIAQGARIK